MAFQDLPHHLEVELFGNELGALGMPLPENDSLSSGVPSESHRKTLEIGMAIGLYCIFGWQQVGGIWDMTMKAKNLGAGGGGRGALRRRTELLPQMPANRCLKDVLKDALDSLGLSSLWL